MTHLLYIANIRLPTERAHGIQIMKTCEALSALGAKVSLLVPKRRTTHAEDPFTYYGVRARFTVRRLPCIDLVFLGRTGAWIQTLSFALSAFVYSLGWRADAIYSRDQLSALLLACCGRRTFWESHMGQWSILTRLLLARTAGFVVISKGLQRWYIEKGVPEQHILVARDGVDLAHFDVSCSQSEARRALGLREEVQLVLYSGSLYDWKGVDALLRSGDTLPEGTQLLVVGGAKDDVATLRERYQSPRISFLGERSYRDIPLFLKAADILVLTGSAAHILSAQFTSPLKLFEYMAAGRPIIASDLPSFREVLDDGSALFVPPGDPHALSDAIARLLREKELSDTLSAQARINAERFSWKGRGDALLSFIAKRISLTS